LAWTGLYRIAEAKSCGTAGHRRYKGRNQADSLGPKRHHQAPIAHGGPLGLLIVSIAVLEMCT